MGDCPWHWICTAIPCFSRLIRLFGHLVFLFILPLGVSSGRFATRSTIGHFGLWHFDSGDEYKADVAPGQHINDFYEYFRVYNR
jgi:hypothetical protein